MTRFYAQPYDISATGFTFDTADQFQAKISSIKNAYGQAVEEFEIQFIDGDSIDAQLAEAVGLNQANICQVMELIDEWSEDQKIRAIIAIGECGYSFDSKRFDPDHIDIDLYEIDSLRDLACDYSMTRIDGTNYAYRCG